MNILFVAPRSWPAVGGMESYLRHLTRELAQRHTVTVLAQSLDGGPTGRLSESLLAPAPFDAFVDCDVRVAPIALTRTQRARMAPLALQVVPGLSRRAYGRARIPAAELFARTASPVIADAARNADVVHMWGCGMLGAAALRAARAASVPYVITPFAHRSQWGDDVASARVYRGADKVLGLLETDAALYEELGAPSARTEVVGVCSPGVQTGGGEALRRRHGIDGPLIVFLGVRRAYKGFDLLLEAAPRVAAQRPDVTFAFVGPGAALPATNATTIDVGEVSDDERAEWLDAADVSCLPSEGEIFPVSILEAWSARTAVVTSDLATLRELVLGNGGGVVAPREPAALGDAIVTALGDPARLATLAESGYDAWQSRFTVDAVTTHHERIYAALAKGAAEPCAA